MTIPAGGLSRHDARKMTERDFKNLVVELAKRGGWLVHHDLPSQRFSGAWSTLVQGDTGFPDLVLVRAPKWGQLTPAVIFAELKTEHGRVRDDQTLWLDALQAAGITAHVWRPSDLPEIVNTLVNLK